MKESSTRARAWARVQPIFAAGNLYQLPQTSPCTHAQRTIQLLGEVIILLQPVITAARVLVVVGLDLLAAVARADLAHACSALLCLLACQFSLKQPKGCGSIGGVGVRGVLLLVIAARQ